MALYFQSICSSSSGNCLVLWTEHTRILIDCGLGSMKRTRKTLTDTLGSIEEIDGVLISHPHADHISHYPLRVMEAFDRPVWSYNKALSQLRYRHFNRYGFLGLRLGAYTCDRFEIGDLVIEPFEVMHYRKLPTCGFTVYHQDEGRWLKGVVVTDFCDPAAVAERLVDADFVFIESNHDMELLRKYYNPNSRYHMPNPETARLLVRARRQSKRAPQAVILGHLSRQRNEAALALGETIGAFVEDGVEIDFPLSAAPLREPGKVFTIC